MDVTKLRGIARTYNNSENIMGNYRNVPNEKSLVKV